MAERHLCRTCWAWHMWSRTGSRQAYRRTDLLRALASADERLGGLR